MRSSTVRKLTIAVSLLLAFAPAAFATHIPEPTEVVSYDGGLAPGVAVTGEIGWGLTPTNGYNWYCFDGIAGRAVTLSVSRTSGDILPNIGALSGLADVGAPVSSLAVINATGNDTTPSTTLTITPTSSGPITIWVSTWLGEQDGKYTLTMTGGNARGACGTGTVATLPDVFLSANEAATVVNSSVSVPVSVFRQNGFTRDVELTAEGLPAGVSATFEPTLVAGPGFGTTMMTLRVNGDTFPMPYLVSLRATADRGTDHERSFLGAMTLRVNCSVPFLLDRNSDQPLSQSVTAGARVTLHVVPSGGSGPFHYQWYQGARGSTSFPIRNVDSAEMTTPPVDRPMDFWVRVSNACGSTDSWTATVTPVGGNGKKTPPRRSPVAPRN